MLSWIQYHILLELTRYPARRYTELRPPDVEGNLFTYHLNGLIKNGLVEKAGQQYQLTVKGLQFAGTLSLETGRTRQQPKILNAIICKNQAGQYLFVRWRRQPNTGLVSFPHGMMHYGKAVMDMAAQELAEKTGLQADLAYRGDVYVRGLHSGEVDRHMLVHVFEASNPQLKAGGTQRPEVSESFWSAIDALSPQEFVPGFYELARLAEEQPTGLLFADLLVNVDNSSSAA